MKEQIANQIVVPCLDDIVHTEANGYTCDDNTCPCNELADRDGDVVVLSIGNNHYLAISHENASKLLDRLLLLMVSRTGEVLPTETAQPQTTH